MATVQRRGAATTAPKDQAAETARKQAQLEWAMAELNNEDAPVYKMGKDGGLEALLPADAVASTRVIVVPVFKYDGRKKAWLPTEEFVRQGNNKAFASLLLMSFPGGSGRERWQDKQWALSTQNNGNFLITALAPMPIDDADRFEAGMLLSGRIDTAYTLTPTNVNNLDQDKWYLNADARTADIPCTDDEGHVYYQKRYYEDDLNYPITPMPKINRVKLMEEIMAAKV